MRWLRLAGYEPYGLGRVKLTEDIVQLLRTLHREYERYFNSPDDLRWKACQSANEKAVVALRSPGLSQLIDPIIAIAIENGHATPGQAAPNLREADRSVIEVERRLGQRLGYKDDDLDELFELANEVLGTAQRKGRVLAALQTAEALADHLERLHDGVRAAFRDSVRAPRRQKNACRKEARQYSHRHLYAVGAIVANAIEQELFVYSYALSLGIYGALPPENRLVPIPMSERLAA
jgi:hypothetical protein